LRAQRAAQGHGHRRGDRPAQTLDAQPQAVDLQVHRRRHASIVPEHAGIGQVKRGQPELPGRGDGTGRGLRLSRRFGIRVGRGLRLHASGHGTLSVADLQQVDSPGSVAGRVQLKCIDTQRFELEFARQRLHVAQRELQALPRQQRPAGCVGQRHVLGAKIPFQHHGRHASLRNCKLQRQVRRQAASRHAHRHRCGHVAEVGGEVQVGHLQVQCTVLVPGKWRGLRTAVEGRAVQLESQTRLDLDVDFSRQVRKERQRQLQSFDHVDALCRPVVKAKLRVAHLQVVQRKAGRIGVGRIGARREARDQVVNVVVTIAGSGQTQHRRVDFERFDHRSSLEKRFDRQVDMDSAHAQQWFAAPCGQSGDRQIVDGHLQAPGLEAHIAQSHGTAECLAGAQRHLPLDQRRHCQPDDGPEQRNRPRAERHPPEPDHHRSPSGRPRGLS
jgi:hypothetical protein